MRASFIDEVGELMKWKVSSFVDVDVVAGEGGGVSSVSVVVIVVARFGGWYMAVSGGLERYERDGCPYDVMIRCAALCCWTTGAYYTRYLCEGTWSDGGRLWRWKEGRELVTRVRHIGYTEHARGKEADTTTSGNSYDNSMDVLIVDKHLRMLCPWAHC